ncbi:MAG: hypothetical protein ACYDH6_07580 [Acidimicrobiales bacterium]
MTFARWARRGLMLAAVPLAAVPLAACEATARVTVSTTSAGRGVIAVSLILDREAAARVGDVGAGLRVDDLRRAGWVVDPLVTAPDGSVTATVHHAFAGTFRTSLGPIGLDVHRHRGLVSSGEQVTGTVDLRDGLDAFSDPSLARALGTSSLAGFVQRLQASGGSVPDLHTQLVLQLPGHPTHVAPGGAVANHTVTWDIPLGQQMAIGASAHATDRVALLAFAVALSALVALAIVVVLRVQAHRTHPGTHGRGHRDQWSLASPPPVRR